MFSIKKEINIEGIGIHSGNKVKMRIVPNQQRGIRFILKNEIIIVNIESISLNNIRSTSLTNGKTTIQTPEHFLSACFALSLSNINVELSSSELPILDGSAIEFIKHIEPNLIKINDEVQYFKIEKKLEFNSNGSTYRAEPADNFIIDATLSYPDHWLKSLSFQYEHSKDSYIKNIAKARTYGFTHEIDFLKEKGLAKGGSLENALVISDTGYLNKPRFKDEIVRHKILDFIGDLAIGLDGIKGHFEIIRPSHQANLEFLKFLKSH